jgi:signal transduction histidine kinase
MVESQIGAKSLTLHVLLAEEEGAEPVYVWADAEKLDQIVLNVLSNAVKFTEPGGRIWIEASEMPESPHDVVVCVSDTGCGLPADKLEAIFEPFVQVRADLTRLHEGAGLGLAISRDLARGMGGELTAQRGVNGGSTFVLTLPRG